MSVSRQGRLASPRSLTCTAALTMGALALGVVAVPAALAAPADGADGTGGEETPESQPATGKTVLTTEPEARVNGDLAAAAGEFGFGKMTPGPLDLGIDAVAGTVPDGATLDLTGAQVTVAFTQLNGALTVPKDTSVTCTFTEDDCVFFPAPALPALTISPSGDLYLPQLSSFTITQVAAPTSGQLLLPAAADAVVSSYTSNSGIPADPASVTFHDPGAYRTIAVTVEDAAGDPVAGSTFDLCTIADETCDEDTTANSSLASAAAAADAMETATTDEDGVAVFDGLFLPGRYTITQTAAADGRQFSTAPMTLNLRPAMTVQDTQTPVTLAVVAAPEAGPTTAAPTKPTPTTAAPNTAAPTTAAPTKAAPTTAAPTSSAPTPAAPTSSAPTTSAVAVPTVAPGKEQTVVLGGFQPHEMVHGVLHSTPVDLGTVEADDNGFATFTFTIPAHLEGGIHSVTMTGATSGVTAEATFTVTVADQDAGGLAYTGADVLPLLALGGGLLVAGVGAVTVASRRRSA
jgi:hypothetical protein